MNRNLSLLLSLGALSLAPALQADVLLPTHSTWEYTFIDPTGDASWNTTTGGWASGPAPFGNTSDADFGAGGTFWPANGVFGDDLWIRTTLDLSSADLSSIQYDLGVDNGFKLYVNGNLISSDNAEGFTSVWEYSGAIASGALVAGLNVVALALEDHGGLTAFDMQIRGDTSNVVVPEASTVISGVALVGLAGLGWNRRRQLAR